MPHQQDPGELEQRAAEELLGDASLRDELTDNEAKPLIDWGLAQVKALAHRAEAEGAAPEPVDEALKNLRRLMKRINRFVGLRVYNDPDALAVELDRLRVVSRKLYGERPTLLPDEAARYALVDEIEGMGNEQVVQRLLALFGPQEAAAGAAPAADSASTDAPAPVEQSAAEDVPAPADDPTTAGGDWTAPAAPAPEEPAPPLTESMPPVTAPPPADSPPPAVSAPPQLPAPPEPKRLTAPPLSDLLRLLGRVLPPDENAEAEDAPPTDAPPQQG